ncbi:MAG: glycosyltransferase [Bacteroidales bacterium]|nr:glycosyltransferase [Bacteroidales bacterium]
MLFKTYRILKSILIIGPAYPFRGGIADTNVRLAEEFIASGVDCKIFTFTKQYPSFLFPGKTQYKQEKTEKKVLIYQKVNSINFFNWLKIGNEIRKMKPDVLLFRYWLPFFAPCFGTIARIAKLNNHTKIFSIIDNFIPHERHFADKILSKYFINAIDACVVMSYSVKAEVQRARKNILIDYSPHPLFDNYGESVPKDIAKKALKLDTSKNYLLFFGLVREYKGLDILLEALPLVFSKIDNLHLIVAGEFYQKEDKYLDIINKNNLKERVHIYNQFIPDSLIPYFFCASDLIVQPYKEATQSGVTQIAYHFNKPMIVTNVGGLPEIVPNGKVGYVVEPNHFSVANAILKFYIENKEKEFSECVKIEKQKYSWKRMERTIHGLYEKLLSNNEPNEQY